MSSAIVRAPSRDEIYRAAEIASIAFESAIDDWVRPYTWLADNCGTERFLVVEADNELVASLICIPGSMRFQKDVVPFSAVGGVATLAEHRRKGYAAMLMEESVRMFKRNGHYTSALWPFSYHYYGKFGWELSAEKRVYTITPDSAERFAPSDGSRPAAKSDIPAMNCLLYRYTKDYNGMALRDDFWWEMTASIYNMRFQRSDDLVAAQDPWVHEIAGVLDGYVLYDVSKEDQTTVRVRELVAENPTARQSLLRSMMAAGIKQVLYEAPVDDNFLQELSNPRAVKAEVEPSFQFRVVDPFSAMELRSVSLDIRGVLGFDIHDPILGCVSFDIDFEDGKVSGAKNPSSERLSMNVNAFSQLYIGYVRPKRAAEIGQVKASSDKALDLAENLFPKAVPYRSTVEPG